MQYLLKNAKVYMDRQFKKADILIDGGFVSKIEEVIPHCSEAKVFDFSDCIIVPGLIDVHVHLREPGFLYKETIETGTMAAAHGGITHICPMPNLNPVPDNAENLEVQLDAIRKTAKVNVYPFAAITKGQKGEELADLEAMAENAIGYSDDGKGVQSDDMMREAMRRAKALGKIISAHCEDESLLEGIIVHDGEFARSLGLKGISDKSEWVQIARDIELVRETGVRYHVCHISSKESVRVIREAKKQGIDITCETGPHYLVLDDTMIRDDGGFKMNPPIRSREDKLALIEGILDGTVDMIATDHAPHSAEEKSKGLGFSMNGIVGLETSFAMSYTGLVKTGIISLEQLMSLMHDNAKERFGIGGEIEIGKAADLAVFDLTHEYEINPEEFLSKGKSTPFAGVKAFGKCLMTFANGGIVWQDNSTEN